MRLLICRVAVIALACLSPSPGNGQASADSEGEQQEFNAGRDPTNFPSTYGLIFSQARFTTGDRLRSVSVRGIYRFNLDYVAATIPVLDFVPGTPSESYVTGLGDILLEYLHVFPYLSEKAAHG